MTDKSETLAEIKDLPVQLNNSNELETIVDTTQFSSIMLNNELMVQAKEMADMMASAGVMVPKHFHGQVGDCYALVLQAIQWRLNPFVVAQKTHLVNGALGYEAQLVVAVLQASGAIRGSFKYEYDEEQGHLTCRAGAKLAGDDELTWGEWINSGLITTKNSPLWKTNPRQQLAYLQSKNWARLYAPAAILGVYTDDELRDNPDFNRQKPQSKSEAAPLPLIDAEDFNTKYPHWKNRVQKGTNSAESIVSYLKGQNTFTSSQSNMLNDLKNYEPIEGNQ